MIYKPSIILKNTEKLDFIKDKKNKVSINLEKFKDNSNNLKLNITKIEILNGLGVFIYNKDNLIKEFFNDKVQIEYIEDLNYIGITLFDEYATFNKFPDIIIYLEKQIKHEYKKELNVDELVFPINLEVVNYDVYIKVNIYENMKLCYKDYLDEKISYEQLLEYINKFSFKIKEIQDKFYLIEKNIKEENFENQYFSIRECLFSIEDIKRELEVQGEVDNI